MSSRIWPEIGHLSLIPDHLSELRSCSSCIWPLVMSTFMGYTKLQMVCELTQVQVICMWGLYAWKYSNWFIDCVMIFELHWQIWNSSDMKVNTNVGKAFFWGMHRKGIPGPFSVNLHYYLNACSGTSCCVPAPFFWKKSTECRCAIIEMPEVHFLFVPLFFVFFSQTLLPVHNSVYALVY